MRSYCIRVVPKSNHWCPYKKRERTHRNVMVEVEIAVVQLQPRNAQDSFVVLSFLICGTLL